MTTITSFHGVELNAEVTVIELDGTEGGSFSQVWEMALQSGGMMCTYLEYPFKEGEIAVPAGDVIYAVKNLREYLTEDEFDALLAHELGHAVAKHFHPGVSDDLDGQETDCGSKVVNSDDYEQQADAFSVSIFSPATLTTAIEKAVVAAPKIAMVNNQAITAEKAQAWSERVMQAVMSSGRWAALVA